MCMYQLLVLNLTIAYNRHVKKIKKYEKIKSDR